MKLSLLIEKLQKVKVEHGDVNVYYTNYDYGETQHLEVDVVEFLENVEDVFGKVKAPLGKGVVIE